MATVKKIPHLNTLISTEGARKVGPETFSTNSERTEAGLTLICGRVGLRDSTCNQTSLVTARPIFLAYLECIPCLSDTFVECVAVTLAIYLC